MSSILQKNENGFGSNLGFENQTQFYFDQYSLDHNWWLTII
jgi:hypothetical protein